MKLSLRGIVSAIVMFGAALSGVAPAGALPVMQAPVQAAPASAEQIHYRPYYHRHNYYRPGFNVYVAPRPYYRPRHYGYNDHVRWCLNHYRSYVPATNRYKTHSGYWKVCYSPYR